MSLLRSFSTGVSGLNAHYNALNTTAHNLANVETKGYVRQQVLHKDSAYNNIGYRGKALLQVGHGVDIASVRQVRDIFLDKSYRLENGRQQFYQVQNQATSEIENILGELDGVAFSQSLEDLWTSIQELSKQPDSIVTRTSLVQSSVSFIERAQVIWNQLRDYQVNLNTQIINEVDRINQIANEISLINDQIRYAESNGLENANDYRDARNLLLDELGNMISISFSEDRIGEVTVYAEGVPLVTPEHVYKMTTKEITGTGLLVPVWEHLKDQEVFNLDKPASSQHNTDIGSLKGLLYTRGNKVANYTDIPVRDRYNSEQEFLDDVKRYNNTIDSSVIMKAQAGFDQLIHSIVTGINDILAPNTDVDYYDGKGDLLHGQMLSPDAPKGMDANASTGTELFSRKRLPRYDEVQVEVEVDGNMVSQTIRLYNEENTNEIHTLYSIGEIEVNPEILANYSKIPLSSGAGTDDYDMEAVMKLVNLWQDPKLKLSPNTLTEYGFQGYYTAFVGDVATNGQQFDTISKNQRSMVNSIDNLRQQTLGVSTDEELSNLISYQHSYNASARYISVIDEMLEHVIMRLG
ncbi:MAG: flagellar hook-associated protein FlgK [Clostridiales bacterium]|nr:flagellar hook-associated protein FlgK [Clostridiales bacterium]